MRRALELAARGWGRVAPNPLVGAVVVKDGLVVGEGWHAEYGQAHAEVAALAAAAERARGATLYVTLEPCNHAGKTPPCTRAALTAGIQRVVFASEDPHPVARGGAEVLRAANIEVRAGVEADAARSLNAPFFRAHAAGEPNRPWTELKLALSLDGKVADSAGRSQWITGEAARAEVHRLRAGSDAIAAGIGTVLADNPRLTVRGAIQPRQPPVRVVFDRTLRIPAEVKLLADPVAPPVWIVCSPEASADKRDTLARRGVTILEASDLREALAGLRKAGIQSLFCEGGAALSSALLSHGLVDRLTLLFAPLFLGPEGINPFAGIGDSPLAEAERWRLVRTDALGQDSLVSVEKHVVTVGTER